MTRRTTSRGVVWSGRWPFGPDVIAALLALMAMTVLEVSAFAQTAGPPSAATPDEGEAAKKEEARGHFERGLGLFDDEQWDPALAEFLRSRQIHPSRAATKNAAICLRNLKRFDEALEMFEELLGMAGLSANDRELAQREIKSLAARVGTIELRGAPA